MPKPNISIIMPAYNEEKRIEKSLVKIVQYSKKHFSAFEIIVVDDCSKDKTNEIVSKYRKQKVRVLRNSVNRGKGYSVKRGMLAARYPLVLFSDSDLATPIEEVKKFIEYTNQGYDIVIASRNLKESNIKVKQPWYRQLMGKTFPLLVNILAVRGIKDTQCGFKLFKAAAAKRIARLQTLERFAFDVELLFIAKKYGYTIKEAPVTWIDKEGSTVHIVRDTSRMLRDLFVIRLNNLRGKYAQK